MNCPRCRAPDFTMTCSACYLLAPRALQEAQAVLEAIKERPSIPTADLVRMLEASGVLSARDVQVILGGIFKRDVAVFPLGPPAAKAPTPPGICPRCHGKNAVWAKRCFHCGGTLQRATVESAAPAPPLLGPEGAHRLLQSAELHEKARRRDDAEAQQHLNQTTESPAQTTDDLFERAAVLATLREQFADALSCLETLLAREPSKIAALILKGDVHVVLNQLDAATDCYERARAASPDGSLIQRKLDALSAFVKAGREVSQKQLATALELYSQAVDRDPSNVRYLLAKALLLCELERYGEALPLLDRGLDLIPRTAHDQVRWAKLRALAELQLVDDAQAFCRQILPRFRDGAHQQQLQEYLKAAPPPLTHQQIAAHWAAQGVTAHQERRFQDAVECAYRAAYIEPGKPGHKAFLGLSLVMLARATKNGVLGIQGLTALTDALAVRRDPTTLFNYMQALHMTDRLNEALRVADELLALTPDDPLVVEVASQIRKKVQ